MLTASSILQNFPLVKLVFSNFLLAARNFLLGVLKLALGLGGWLDIWWVGNGPGFGIGKGVGTLLVFFLVSSWVCNVSFFNIFSFGWVGFCFGVGNVVLVGNVAGVGIGVGVVSSCSFILFVSDAAAGRCFCLFLGLDLVGFVGNGVGIILGVGIGNGVGTFGQVGSFCCFWLGFGKWVGNFGWGCRLVCLFFFLLVVLMTKSHTSIMSL